MSAGNQALPEANTRGCVQNLGKWDGACIPSVRVTLGPSSWGGLGTLGRDLLRKDSEVRQVRDIGVYFQVVQNISYYDLKDIIGRDVKPAVPEM